MLTTTPPAFGQRSKASVFRDSSNPKQDYGLRRREKDFSVHGRAGSEHSTTYIRMR